MVYIGWTGEGDIVTSNIPREEGPSSKSGIQRSIGVRNCGGVNLSSSTETIEGIEQP